MGRGWVGLPVILFLQWEDATEGQANLPNPLGWLTATALAAFCDSVPRQEGALLLLGFRKLHEWLVTGAVPATPRPLGQPKKCPLNSHGTSGAASPCRFRLVPAGKTFLAAAGKGVS